MVRAPMSDDESGQERPARVWTYRVAAVIGVAAFVAALAMIDAGASRWMTLTTILVIAVCAEIIRRTAN